MKNYSPFYAVFGLAFLSLFVVSCSKDEDPVSKINHKGEKWIITSVEYNLIDQRITNPAQWYKSGTEENAGAFYFDGSQGTFDISIPGYRLEDYFNFELNGTSISMTSVEQQVGGAAVSQNVISIGGEKDTEVTMQIDGTITEQSTTTGQFVFTGSFVLTKE